MSDESNSSMEIDPRIFNHGRDTVPSVITNHSTDAFRHNGHYQQRLHDRKEPYIEIIEQPKSRGFRFRYACEGKSHGGLQGESSDKHKKTYPSIKIHNYKGLARIVVKLVTDENVSRPHAHELIGKNCSNGLCVMEVKPEKTQTEIIFSNIGILHVTKKKVPDILKTRIMEDMKSNKLVSDSLNSIDIGNIELTDEEQKQAQNQAEEQAKTMLLNVVRLCFQVYLADQNGLFTKLLPQVTSQPIYDCKAPGAAALKICRMDKHSGFCTGQEEIFLLCDKVQKEDIAVRFFEIDEERKVKWEAYGSFGPADVHRQYAIVFRTPPYSNTDIDKPVNVYVQLKRLGDGETSDPKPFAYIPVQKDQDELDKKRMKTLPDFNFNGHLTSARAVQPPVAAPTMTLLTRPVNGTIHTIVSPQVNGGIYVAQQNPQVVFNGTNNSVLSPTNQMQQPVGYQNQPAYANSPPGHVPLIQPSRHEASGYQFYSMTGKGCAAAQPIDLSKVQNGVDNVSSHAKAKLSRIQSLKKNNMNDIETDSCPYDDNEMDDVDAGQIKYLSIHQDIDSGFKSYNPSVSISVSEKASVIEVPAESVSTSDEVVKAAGSSAATPSISRLISGQHTNTINGYKSQEEKVHTDEPIHVMPCETVQEVPINTHIKPAPADVCVVQDTGNTDQEDMETLAWRVAENTAVALQHFARTGNIAYLLLIQRHLVAVQDENGDNALHIAVIHRRIEPLRHLLLAAASLQENVAINCFNALQQTPLHLAIITNQPDMVELLVKYHADVSMVDRNGNTAAHLATLNGYERCLQGLISTSLTISGPMFSLNKLNYDGLSPLQLAIRRGNLNCVRNLVVANADVNLTDGKGGYTALHHAVDTEHLGIVGYLLLEASADPNIPNYSGNTALHIAVGRDLLSIAALLVASGADPEAESTEGPSSSDSEGGDYGSAQRQMSGEDIDMYEEGITPMDLAQGNEKMLKILRGDPYSSVSESLSQQTNDTASLYSGLMDSGLGLMSQDGPGDLEKLDLVTRMKLAHLLDKSVDGEGWESLARHVGLTSLINAFKTMRSPTRAILDNLEVLDGTIKKLKEAFLKMKRQDAIRVIDDGLALHDQAAKELLERRAKDPVNYVYQNYTLESQIGNLSLRSQKEQ